MTTELVRSIFVQYYVEGSQKRQDQTFTFFYIFESIFTITALGERPKLLGKSLKVEENSTEW